MKFVDPYEKEQLEIVRRIAERGLSYALQEKHSHFVDVFQHL